ncbi:MAG: transposase [Proteiniphilum sp.]|nr:transposase [Proteiniphilum sp.]
MSKYKQQSHVVWKCDYHVVWCPKYRFRILTGIVKDLVEHDIRMLCEWKGCDVLAGNKKQEKNYFAFLLP